MLYIVATPIGNLKDITLRALKVLKGVDFILAEDTRVTKKLLAHYKINKPLISYHHHSKEEKTAEIVRLLKEGKNLALVTDAGTPGIADPGNELIAKVSAALGDAVEITPIPGPSALIAAASISGMPMNEFLFLGYPPSKKKRKKFFERVLQSSIPVVLYESPHRIIKTLEEIKDNGGFTSNYSLVVARELTKKFEKVYRGNIDEILVKLKGEKMKGEFTIVVRKVTSNA